MTRGGLPHSDIPGSKLVCSSPGLFAACHVLHRLLAPRHSPYTLSSLTIKLKTDAHQSFACQLVCDSFFRNTARVCGRKKLPCAEYSVVKDQMGALPQAPGSVARGALKPRSASSLGGPLRALSESVNVGHLSERRSRSAKTIGADVGAGEARGLHHSTETFSAFALRATARSLRWLASRSPARGEGWWRIPVSNR